MARRRRKGKGGKWVGRLLTALLLLPALYMTAALIGSLVPLNRGWTEPAQGTTVYLATNAIHTDIIMPVKAQGLDWRPLFPSSDFAEPQPGSAWIAFGSGEEHVYLNTATWWDLTPTTVWSALTGGRRVMHVEYVPDPHYGGRQIRLRPEEYRRLWAAVRASLAVDEHGRPKRMGHPGYGPADAFYQATGKANAFRTCNTVAARWLSLAGVKVSSWPPFVNGLVWRYREVPPHGGI